MLKAFSIKKEEMINVLTEKGAKDMDKQFTKGKCKWPIKYKNYPPRIFYQFTFLPARR